MTLDLAERLLGFQESGRRPAQRSLGVAVATRRDGSPRRTAPFGFSITLVLARQRISEGVSFSRLTVKVS